MGPLHTVFRLLRGISSLVPLKFCRICQLPLGCLLYTSSQLYDDSNSLSQCILDAYCDATGFENRGVTYADNMAGINWSTIPVTIVEMGFMTNESDDLKMSNPDFQNTMASGIADGIDAYFAEK